MNILLTGATGFIGRALMLRLQRDGHRLTAAVRDPARARQVLGDDVAAVPIADPSALAAAVAGADAVINLAGESIIARRWTAKRRRALRDSRIGVTEAIAAAAARRPGPLPLLISASAVGIYGDRADDVLDERSGAGPGFAAELCAEWEEAAARAGAARTVLARFGIVLGPEGGIVGQLRPLVRSRTAARLGSGRQWISWIHLEDLVDMIAQALTDERWRGPVNVVAPVPVRHGELMHELASALGGAAPLRIPAPVLRLAMGARAAMVLESQRCIPAAAVAWGYRFRFPRLSDAVGDLAADQEAVAISRVRSSADVPAAPYLADRRPRYVLETCTELDARLPDVFRFFADAGNLELLTPPTLGFRITTPRPIAMAEGAVIDYALRMSGVPMSWRTVIERWQPDAVFVDTQTRGPYRAWWHEHRFVAHGDRTVMEDRVYYAPPFGVLGRAAHTLFIRPTLQRIFGFRRHAIRLRFGT